MAATREVLHTLVRRAARYERPFNTQDSILILRALHDMRYRSEDVRSVCEKCAFTIASARITVPVERVIDLLNALTSLQATSLTVVHEKLADRLLEVSPHTASPRSIQKAAVVLMKLGKRYCKPVTANHIFDVLTQLVVLHPTDVALRLAVISVFPYTSGAMESKRTRHGDCDDKNVYALCVLEAARHLVDARVLGNLRGNSTLQALHMFPVIAQHSVTRSFSRINAESDVESTGGEYADDRAKMWDHVEKAFCNELQLSSVVPGGYAQFLYDFLPTFLADKRCDRLAKLLGIIYDDRFRKALNSYDVAKIAMAVSSAISKRYPRRFFCLHEEDIVWMQRNCLEEQTLFLHVFGSLVDQLLFFYRSSWTSCSKTDSRSDNGGRSGGCVDQVAVGSIWRMAHKCVCEMRMEGVEAKNIVTRLVLLTESVSDCLPDVWSWILYSISMCARTAMYTTRMDDVMETVIRQSFLACEPSKLQSSLPIRSCVQALYALTILMVPSTADESILRRPQISAERQEMVHSRLARWGPAHPLVGCILQRLLQFRYRDYLADDVPMLLQALTNLADAAGVCQMQLPQDVHEMIERLLHYLQGNRNADWFRKHGVGVSSTLMVLSGLLPENRRVRDIATHFLSRVQLLETIELRSLYHLLEHAVFIKRKSLGANTWPQKQILAIAAAQIPVACKDSRSSELHLLLNCADLANELGSLLVFIDSVDGDLVTTDEFGRVSIKLNLSALMRNKAMTPVDAAHVLCLMSYSVMHRSNASSPQKDHILTLCRMSVDCSSSHTMQVQTLLYLLKANSSLNASNFLFEEAYLDAIMSQVCRLLIGYQHDGKQLWDVQRIVRAFLPSQVLVRLKRTVQSYDGLSEAVKSVLDTLESKGLEKPDTLFKLQLLSGH